MFVQRLDSRELTALYKTAARARDLLCALRQPWWLSHGTLLGAWRHQGVIPWDDDLDVAFPREQIRELEGAAKARGWGFARLAPFLAKVWNPRTALHRTRCRWTWPFVDLCLYDVCGGRILIEYGHHTRFQVFAREDILPVREQAFGPMKMPVPRRPEVLLRAIYPEWDKRPASSGYCHRREQAYAEPTERKSITALASHFPLFNVADVEGKPKRS